MTSDPVLFDWRETVKLEHEDRRARFERLAALGLVQTPLFYSALISGRDLPQFGVDIPVLRVVFPERVYFDTDEATLRPEAEAVIQVIADSLRRDVPDVALFIAGHADARGSDEYNYLLSVERADAVARALKRRGVGTTRIWRIGFGEAVPVRPNITALDMGENRRVEFLFAAKAEAVAVWLSRQEEAICAVADGDAAATCREKVALLPPLVAKPVLNDTRTEIAAIQRRDDAFIDERRRDAEISGSIGVVFDDREPAEASTADDERQSVEIEQNDSVIIDLNDKRVETGVPYL